MQLGFAPLLLALFAVPAGCAASPRGDDPVAQSERIDAAIVDVEAGRVEAGVNALEAALAAGGLIPGDRARAHAFAGHGRTLLGDPEGALAHFELGRSDAPNDAWLCYASGVALQTLGRTDEARAAFTDALARDPRHLKSLQWRAEVALEVGENAAAVADLARVLGVLDEASPAALAEWGGDPLALRTWTLRRQALALGRLGDRTGAGLALAEAARLDEAVRLELRAGAPRAGDR